jgi:hypothetical protein
MSGPNDDNLGELDDNQEAGEPSSTTEGPAAEGDYDPAQGSPGVAHAVGEDYPEEATRYGDSDRRRSESGD